MKTVTIEGGVAFGGVNRSWMKALRGLAGLGRGLIDRLSARITGHKISGNAYCARYHATKRGTVVDVFVDGAYAGSTRAFRETPRSARAAGEHLSAIGFEFHVPDRFCDGEIHRVDLRLQDGLARCAGFPKDCRLVAGALSSWERGVSLEDAAVDYGGEVGVCERFEAEESRHGWERKTPLGFERIPDEARRREILSAGPVHARDEALVCVRNATLVRGGAVVLHDGTLLRESTTKAGFESGMRLDPEYNRMLLRREVTRIEQRAASVQRMDILNYGRWAIEMLPQVMMLEDCPGGMPEVLCFLVEAGSAVPDFVTRTLKKQLPVGTKVLFLEEPLCQVEELYLPMALQGHAGAGSRVRRSTVEFYRSVRRSLELDRAEKGRGRRLFVSREDADRRRMHNEDALSKRLLQLGFERIVCTERSPDERVELFSEAEVVVGVQGSNLTDAIFCRPGTLLIDLLPQDCDGGLGVFRDLADVFGLRFGVIPVGASPGKLDEADVESGHHYVNVEEVADGIEEMLREHGASS